MSARLDPDDVDLIARRVLDLLRADQESVPARLVDAKTLAAMLGVTRAWVYAHAEQLAAVRLGAPRGRLRFDANQVLVGRQQQTARASATKPPKRAKLPARGAKLLPIDP